ncbi:hypothetical protein BOX15_Mlig012350g3, partial [Macrostomum lignano]
NLTIMATEDVKQQDEMQVEKVTTFADLGVNEALCDVIASLQWRAPTAIQVEAIPLALSGRDVIGLAETGSGKTAAFALPIIQALLDGEAHPNFALVLTPTRELAIQIQEQFQALGKPLGVRTICLVGGLHKTDQAIVLSKRQHHVIIATPGRLADHLADTKGFDLRRLRFLVLDEADRILNMDFEDSLTKILKELPRDRRTFLFSATMTKKVAKLQRASLRDPVKVEVSGKYSTVDKLSQYYLFIPAKLKDHYLAYLLHQLSGSTIVFTHTRLQASRVALLLRALGFSAVPLHGQMAQNKRIAALNKFRARDRGILVATDVASRGLDIPHVDNVLNFDLSSNVKDYVHRVGRTARAGRPGKSVTFVTQYDVMLYMEVERAIGKKLPLYEVNRDEVVRLGDQVSEAQRIAKMELQDLMKGRQAKKRRGGADDDGDDGEDAAEADEAADFDSGDGAAGRKKIFAKRPNKQQQQQGKGNKRRKR